MALCRQGSGGLQDWSNSFGPTLRSHDHGNMRQQGDSGNGLYRAQPKSNRGRKLGRAAKSQGCSIGVIVVVFFGLVGLTLLGNHSREKGGQESSEREELFDNQNSEGQDYTWAETNHNIGRDGRDEILHQRDGRKQGHILVHRSSSWASKVLGFGQGSSGSGQDSRYWDRDDRRRDEEYDKNVGSAFKLQKNGLGNEEEDISENGFNIRRESGADKDDMDKIKEATYFEDLNKHNRSTANPNGQDFGKESLYNEHGRDELKVYEAQYEADLQEELSLNKTAKGDGLMNTDLGANIRGGIGENSSSNAGNNKNLSQIQNYKQNAIEDEYDDGIDDDDARAEDNISEISHQRHHVSRMKKDHDRNNLIETQKHQAKSFDDEQKELSEKNFSENFDHKAALLNDSAQGYDHNNFSEVQSNLSTADSKNGKLNETLDSKFDKESTLFISVFDEKWSQNVLRSEKLANASDIASWKVDTLKRNTNSSRSKRRRRPSPPCEIAFLNSSDGLQEPEENPKFAKFSLEYIQREEKPGGVNVWEPRFAGHQSLEQREDLFYARDQKVHCGFVKGPEGSTSTGFDLDKEDTEFLSTCHIAVSSCIFGNSDNIRIPTKKKLSQNSKKNVCFVMFVDEKTLETMSLEGRQLDENGYIGLWKIVVVRNLPYTDMRRTGKVPKFLAHRLFPSARYSIWLDSKMRLNSDPLLILEYFLWRGGFEYAIANHYDRHCVWEEVMQNKRLNKFNYTVIDEQFASYQADGLIKFNETDPNKLLPSYVPEGSFIVRAHTPMSNLFSCLWFNEVDRFTPRDQLSFAYTFLKLRRRNPETHFWLNMFKDCERRFMAKLFHHRTEGTPPSSGSSKQ